MSGNLSGNYSTVQTLAAANSNVFISGTINAYGSVGVYTISSNGGLAATTIDAAVFGPSAGHFTITNTGLIESAGPGSSSHVDVGIALALPGTVFNGGTILAGNGIGMLGTSGAYVENSNFIAGTLGSGIYFQGAGSISNSGAISGFDNGVELAGGGFATNAASGVISASGNDGIEAEAAVSVFNSGTILGQNGIGVGISGGTATTLSNAGYVNNSGTVQAYSTSDVDGNFSNGFNKIGVGVYFAAAGTVVNRGSIAGNHVGIVIENGPGTVTNTGTITSSRGYGVYLNTGGTVSNTGGIIGYDQGIFIGSPAPNQATVNSVRSISNNGFVDAAATIISYTIGSSTYTGLSDAIFVIGAATIDNQINGTVEAKDGEGIDLFAAADDYETGQVSPADGAIINAGTVNAQYGVYLYGIGSLTNTGTIIGEDFGFNSGNQAASGFNSGLIEAAEGGFVNVVGTTTMSGVGTAVEIKGGGNFTNTSAGTLSAAAGYGVYLAAGGSINNAGSIIGYRDGVRAKNARATIVNSGAINATAGTFTTGGAGSGNGLPPGTYFSHGIDIGNGRITNTASGTVTGQAGIIISGTNSGGYILNAGHVTAAGHAGLYMKSSGTIVNSGSVQGPKSGIDLEGGGLINNSGTDSAKTGIYLAAGGTVQNSDIIAGTNFGIYDLAGISNIRNTGSITGAHDGILAFSASSYVYNTGSIGGSNTTFTLAGVAGFSAGIGLLSSGTVSSASAGVITGRIGIGLEGTSGTSSTILNAGLVDGNYLGISSLGFATVSNSKIIEALGTASVADEGNSFAGTGIALNAGGTVMNAQFATIAAYETGVYLNGSAGVAKTVINDGIIEVSGGTFGTVDSSGVAIFGGGVVKNLAAGTIAGLVGIYLTSGTVSNGGTISETGPSGAAVYIKGSGEIIDDPGAVFNGLVAFGDGGGLDLTSGTEEGTLSGFGTQFLGFTAVQVDDEAVWDITGATSLAGYITLTNYGTIAETGADALTISGAVTGTGMILLDPTTVTLNGSVSAGQQVSFANTGDVLDLGDASQFNGTITGFATGDTINLANIAFDSITGETFVNGVLTLSEAAGPITLTFANPAVFTGNPALTPAGDGTGITAQTAPCFAAGTRILTAGSALVPVEALQIGDEIELFSGAAAPVRWIGRRALDLRRHPRPEAVQPILIAAGALGQGLPWRDLIVSPDHGMYLDGHLITAKALLNGFSIRQLNRKTVIYYHIELPEHAVLFAEGAGAESYLETGNRAAFENAGGAMLLHPDLAQALRERASCAPFAESGPAVEAVRRRILDLAGIETTDEPALTIRYEKDTAIIESRAAIPGEIFADPRDRRRLGVKIAALAIRGKSIPLNDPSLVQGWHGLEPDGRWTNGCAIVQNQLLDGSATLDISLAAMMRYPRASSPHSAALREWPQCRDQLRHHGLPIAGRSLMKNPH